MNYWITSNVIFPESHYGSVLSQDDTGVYSGGAYKPGASYCSYKFYLVGDRKTMIDSEFFPTKGTSECQFIFNDREWPEGPKKFLAFPYRGDKAGFDTTNLLIMPKHTFEAQLEATETIAKLESRVAKLESNAAIAYGVGFFLITGLCVCTFFNAVDISKNYKLLSTRIDLVKQYASNLFTAFGEPKAKKK